MNLKKRKKLTKSTNQMNKIFVLSRALVICLSLILFPAAVYAADLNTNVAPPTVEAEIIGSMLKIRATPGFYAVESVYVNDRRFNHRVDSALVIDISEYIAVGDTIAVHAVDFAGNHSNTVLLSSPVPAQPPVPNNITPEGHGELLDHISDSDKIEFITVETPAGNVFYLIIDHTRSSNNVYFLNPVTEWDLLTLAAEAELPIPAHIAEPPPATEAVTVEPEPPPATETPTEPIQEPVEEKKRSRVGLYIFLAIAGVAGFGILFYLKVLKPKKDRETYIREYNEETTAQGDDFEDVDNDGDEQINESEELADGYDVDEDKYYNEGDENK